MTTPIDSEALRPHYARFLEEERVLLTGHSHQAWPDVARDACIEAFDDAAALVDDKWVRATAAADAIREGIARRIGARAEEIALGPNTHTLGVRFLSALDLRTRPQIITTRGEFHALYRQLSRLSEAGLDVTFVDPHPIDELAERLAASVTERTAALMASTVLFETATVVPGLAKAAKRARSLGAEVFFDAYHAYEALPFTVDELGGDVFVTAGGYKYAQWGEGVCWLRIPSTTELRPVYTGWFSDFAGLADPRDGGPVRYGPRPADRFAGSTYDPVSHYRARSVLRFFDDEGLTTERLRATSLRQTQRILDGLDGLDIRTPRTPERRGGFVTVAVDDADRVVRALRERRIFTDARGRMLRLGPAPYVTDTEIDLGVRALRDIIGG